MAITTKGIQKYHIEHGSINGEIYQKFITDYIKESKCKNKYFLIRYIKFHRSEEVLNIIKESGNHVIDTSLLT